MQPMAANGKRIATLEFVRRVFSAGSIDSLKTQEGVRAAIAKFTGTPEPIRMARVKTALGSCVIEGEHPFSIDSLTFKMKIIDGLDKMLGNNRVKKIVPKSMIMKIAGETGDVSIDGGKTYLFNELGTNQDNQSGILSAGYEINNVTTHLHAVFNGNSKNGVVASEIAASIFEMACYLGFVQGIKDVTQVLEGIQFELERNGVQTSAAIVLNGKETKVILAGDIQILFVNGREGELVTTLVPPLGETNADKKVFEQGRVMKPNDIIVLATPGFIREGEQELLTDKMFKWTTDAKTSFVGFGEQWLRKRGLTTLDGVKQEVRDAGVVFFKAA